MANSDGKIYKNKSASPKLGVSVGDMQTVLSTSANDMGQIVTDTDVIINKWAKYKPLRSSKLGILTDAERASLNHGLVINKYTTIAGIEGASGDWEYQRPRGLSQNEWFRHDDFAHESLDLRGYNHYAECFVYSADIPSRYVKASGGIRVQINFTPDAQLPQDSIGMADLYDVNGDAFVFGDMYLGVLLSKGGNYRYKTSSDTIGDNGYWAEVYFDEATVDGLDLGDCTVYMFAVYTQSTAQQTTVGDINNKLMAGAYVFPGIAPATMTIVPNTANVVIYKLQAEEITGGLKVYLDVKYNAGQSTPVSNVNVKLYTDLNGETQIGTSGGYGGWDSSHSDYDRVSWLIPATLTTYISAYGNNYLPGLQIRTTYGTKVKAVLTYTIGQNDYSYERSVRIGDPEPPSPYV